MRSGFRLVVLVLLVATAAVAAEKKVFTDPKDAGPDYALQGEYVGTVQNDSGEVTYGAQVIALGDGKFRAVDFRGGLPGAGWDRNPSSAIDGQMKDGVLRFVPETTEASIVAELKDGQIVVKAGGTQVAVLKKVERTSPTLGQKPPAGAVVLFDGTSGDKFQNGRVENGLLLPGVTSKQKFQSFSIHLEFRTPFQPYDRGQGRGNSGFYAQGRYEVQILDSFGLSGENNECGGIYTISKPKVNMCLPPLTWQTYDADYTAAEFRDGKKVRDARMTVRHNGVLVQENVELTHATTAAPVKEGQESGPIYLQDHGNPVRFRNVWVVEK